MSHVENHGSQKLYTLRKDAPKAYRPPADWKQREDFVYIGRAHQALDLPQSLLGNPFVIGRDGNRNEVIARYEARLEQMLANSLMIRNLVTELRGKKLVCWCAPERCHGEVLLRRCEQIWKEQEEMQQVPLVSVHSPAAPLTNPQTLQALRKEYEAYIATQCAVAREKAKKIKDQRTLVLWSQKVMRPILQTTFHDWLHRRETK